MILIDSCGESQEDEGIILFAYFIRRMIIYQITLCLEFYYVLIAGDDKHSEKEEPYKKRKKCCKDLDWKWALVVHSIHHPTLNHNGFISQRCLLQYRNQNKKNNLILLRRRLHNKRPRHRLRRPSQRQLPFHHSCLRGSLLNNPKPTQLRKHISMRRSKDVDEAFRAHINLKVLRFGMMGSAVGSVMGCIFLVLSMVNVIEIRLGMISCGSKNTIHAVTALVVLVSSALLVYITTAIYAFLH
ncbi:maternal effect embryo arrest 60 [Euphorbia peplus]|nr:maternal effect embryo arrest 60 [Euphorbia peplus]